MYGTINGRKRVEAGKSTCLNIIKYGPENEPSLTGGSIWQKGRIENVSMPKKANHSRRRWENPD